MPALTPDIPRGSRSTSAWVLIALAACVVTMRVHLYSQPLDRDITNYAVLAHEWAAGRPLYTDLWLHSPPGIVWVYRVTEMWVGYGQQEMFALGLTCALGTLFSIYVAVVAATGSRTGGRWAALLWMLFSGSLTLQCSQPNCEAPMTTCLAAALALLLYRPRKPSHRMAMLGLAGLFLALDSLIKQITLPLTAGIALSLILWPFPSITRRRAVLESGTFLAGTVLAWLALLLQLKCSGTLQAFWQLNVDFNLAYSRGSGSSGMLANIAHLWRHSPSSAEYDRRWLLVMLAGMTAVGCAARSKFPAYAKGLLVATAAGSLLAVALPGNFFAHYYQLILPNICLATGMVAAIPLAWNKLRTVALGVVSFAVFFNNTRHYALSPGQWSLAEFHDPVDVLCVQLQNDLATILKPGETFFEWGDEPQLFFYTRRPPPTGYLFAYTILSDRRYQGPWSEHQTDQAIEQLERTQPAVLILYVSDNPPSANPKLGAWLDGHYRHWVGNPYNAFRIYRR